MSEKESKSFCDYPNCLKTANYAPMKITDDKWLHLCEEHYNLWKFIDNLLFQATISINTRKSRFVINE